MACSTCGHTMQCIVHGDDVHADESGIYWCPRCGTLKIGHEDGHEDIIAPSLVERCRVFQDRLALVASGDARPWDTLGIREAINLPENRK